MMRLAWQWVREQVFTGIVEAGYDDLNPSHVNLFRYPTLDGLRPIELADQLQITKQSVNDLLGHLEQRGYITREPDPADGRARVIRLTAKGRRLEKTAYDEAKAAELHVAELLGSRRFHQFRDTLHELVDLIANDQPSSGRK